MVKYIYHHYLQKHVYHFSLNGKEFKSCLKSNSFRMNSAPLGTMEANNESFGVINDTEAELIDKVLLLANDAGCNYLTADCISELSQTEAAQDESCSVEVLSDTCKVHKYYTETAAAIVENHFSRSFLAQSLAKQANMNERDTVKKTGASRRKAKRKPTVTSLMPSRAQVTTDARVYPYTFIQPAYIPQSSPGKKVEIQSGYQYMPSMPQYCVQYQTYSIKSETDVKPPVYKAFCKGNTLIEVYSPSVGRGFNPRYNSLLIEPTVQAFLPPITGLNTTMSAAMADLHTFHHMAVEFNIPS